MKQIVQVLKHRYVKTTVNALFTVFVLIFLALYIAHLDFSHFSWAHINGGLFIGSLALGAFTLFLLPLGWMWILASMGARLHRPGELNYIFAKSWMGRYLPGKVTWLAGKVMFAQRQGIKSEILVISSILEVVAQLITATVIGCVFLLVAHRTHAINTSLIGAIAAAVLVLFIILAPRLINWLIRLAYYIRYREWQDRIKLSRRTTVVSLAAFTVFYLANSVPQFLMAQAVVPNLGWANFWFVAGSFLIAGVVGILAVFAPSGLGVREGVIILLMQTIIQPADAIVLAVASRIWAVITDIVFFGIAFVCKGRQLPARLASKETDN